MKYDHTCLTFNFDLDLKVTKWRCGLCLLQSYDEQTVPRYINTLKKKMAGHGLKQFCKNLKKF